MRFHYSFNPSPRTSLGVPMYIRIALILSLLVVAGCVGQPIDEVEEEYKDAPNYIHVGNYTQSVNPETRDKDFLQGVYGKENWEITSKHIQVPGEDLYCIDTDGNNPYLQGFVHQEDGGGNNLSSSDREDYCKHPFVQAEQICSYYDGLPSEAIHFCECIDGVCER